jgi:hypothetical protein
VPGNPGCGERALHPGVGGDDRTAQVGFRSEVVDRLVERGGQVLGRTAPRRRQETRAGLQAAAPSAISTRG